MDEMIKRELIVVARGKEGRNEEKMEALVIGTKRGPARPMMRPFDLFFQRNSRIDRRTNSPTQGGGAKVQSLAKNSFFYAYYLFPTH